MVFRAHKRKKEENNEDYLTPLRPFFHLLSLLAPSGIYTHTHVKTRDPKIFSFLDQSSTPISELHWLHVYSSAHVSSHRINFQLTNPRRPLATFPFVFTLDTHGLTVFIAITHKLCSHT